MSVRPLRRPSTAACRDCATGVADDDPAMSHSVLCGSFGNADRLRRALLALRPGRC